MLVHTHKHINIFCPLTCLVKLAGEQQDRGDNGGRQRGSLLRVRDRVKEEGVEGLRSGLDGIRSTAGGWRLHRSTPLICSIL